MYECAAKAITRGLHVFDAETAHGLSIKGLKAAILPPITIPDNLAVEVAGLTFPSPFGVAAGYDKNGEVPHKLMQMGFGAVEVGTITPKPQAGNPKPRMFRLSSDKAVINRLGFNSRGADVAYANLSTLRHKDALPHVLGINVGANKDAVDKVADYVFGVEKFAPLADYLTVNISSPNTKGLRDLQKGDEFIRLIEETLSMRDAAPNRPPVFFKLAPDLEEAQIDILARQLIDYKIDGVILANTTIQRPDILNSRFKTEQGGLSGAPLKDISLATQQAFYNRLKGKVPIIGVGGIESFDDVQARQKAGAQLMQIYTAMVYEGFGLVRNLNKQLSHEIAGRS